MLPLLLLLAQTPDPRQLLERAITATQRQSAERARYFGREDVQTFRIHNGKRKRISWHVYEAMILDGRIRYKRTWTDGKPIPAKRQQLQAAGKRWGLHYEQVLANHDLTFIGAATLENRPVWHVRANLRPTAPLPNTLDDLALLGSLDLWLDRESGMDLQSRLEVTRPYRGLERGAVIETRLMKVDQVFVASRAFISIPASNGAVETIQTYSDYRRFSSDSVIRFEPESP